MSTGSIDRRSIRANRARRSRAKAIVLRALALLVLVGVVAGTTYVLAHRGKHSAGATGSGGAHGTAGSGKGGAATGPGGTAGPDTSGMLTAMGKAGTARIQVHSFDGRRLATGTVAVLGDDCAFDLTTDYLRLLGRSGRVFARPVDAAAATPWSELTKVDPTALDAAHRARLGLDVLGALGGAVRPCGLGALLTAPGVVVEEPAPNSWVLALTAWPRGDGHDVVAGSVAARVEGGNAHAVTVELDLDARQLPTRIRVFSGTAFDSEAQFLQWGVGAPPAVPPAAQIRS